MLAGVQAGGPCLQPPLAGLGARPEQGRPRGALGWATAGAPGSPVVEAAAVRLSERRPCLFMHVQHGSEGSVVTPGKCASSSPATCLTAPGAEGPLRWGCCLPDRLGSS